MSQHQPGPYGVPPQQPNPYGQNPYGQGGTPGQGSGFPQQPGGWGPPGQYPPPMPPVPPVPPKGGGGKGKAIGIAVAALVVVGAIVGGIVVFTGSDTESDKGGGHSAKADGSASPSTPETTPTAKAKARYKLITPDTLTDGYKKDASDPGAGFDAKALDELKGFGMTDPQSVTASYKAGEDKRAQKLLRFSGAWGDSVRSPEALVDGLFKSAQDGAAKDTDPSSKAAFEGSPQRMNPDGLGDAVMKCQMTKWSNIGSTGRAIRMPLCVWADGNTVGTVFALDTSLMVRGEDLGLDEAATRVAKLREGVRVADGG
ncbi:hypothetical protein [Streptomyces sp. NPDC002537]